MPRGLDLPSFWRHARTNALVVGPDRLIEACVRMMAPYFARPTQECRLPGPLVLPREGTLVLHDVAAMQPAQQLELFDWLSANHGRVQVFSTTSQQLLDRVRKGAFHEGLFYRLNVICEELAGVAPVRAAGLAPPRES
jgi:transcriptional regulator of aromatic amino acid metabolism